MCPLATSDLERLRSIAASLLKQVDEYASNSESDSSAHSNGDLHTRSEGITRACAQIKGLVTDPNIWLVQSAWSYYKSIGLRLAIVLNIPELVSQGEMVTTLQHLVEQTKASSAVIKRIMRQCVAISIFDEPAPQCYRHNQHSLRLLDKNMRSLIDYLVDDGLLCGAYLTKTLEKHNFHIPTSPSDAAICQAFSTHLDLYSYFNTVDTKRGHRFARGMTGHYDTESLDRPIESIYSFANLPEGSLLVDVGGGNGQQAIRLAVLYPNMSFVVQDHASVVFEAKKAANANLSPEVSQRIVWEAHDFYKPQPRRGAAIYLLSHVLMDNSDKKCAEMVKAIIDAMRPGYSKLLVHDFMDVESFGLDRPTVFDQFDWHMIASLNVHSRTKDEWTQLLQNIDSRLHAPHVWACPDGSAVLEIGLTAGDG